jgi:hypothetical protein
MGRALCRLPKREFNPGQEKETDMENLTYEIYLANPRVREQIEREVRRARAEAMYQYVVAPLAKMFCRMFMRAQPKPAPSLDLNAGRVSRRPEFRAAVSGTRVSSAAGSVA